MQPHAPPVTSAGDLTVLPTGRISIAVAVDPAGDVLVRNAIIRADGRVVELPVPAGMQASAVGITNSGTTVTGQIEAIEEATKPSDVVPEVQTIWHC